MTAEPEDAGRTRTVVRLAEVESTQEIAFALAGAAAGTESSAAGTESSAAGTESSADGAVVVADFQSAGRGRRGRQWVAPPRSSLLMSVVVRPRVPAPSWPLYSLTAAVAVADSLDVLGATDISLRWPNDVLVGGRKIAGVLLEARLTPPRETRGSASHARPDGVIAVGIGMNLTQREFPGGLRGPATSVALATGRDVERDIVLGLVLDAFERWRAVFETEGFEPVRARWLARSSTIGQRVRVDRASAPGEHTDPGASGLAVDLALDGSLIVDDAGTRRHVIAGELTVAVPDAR